MSEEGKSWTIGDEVKQVILIKMPIFILGAAIGLVIVWVALQFIPAAAVDALSNVSKG